MAEVTIVRPDENDPLELTGQKEGLDLDQVLNIVSGINKTKNAIQQLTAQGKEFLGLAPGGAGEVATQKAIQEQQLIDESRAAAVVRTGAGAAEFAGEVLPFFTVPGAAFAGGARGAVTGGLFGLTQFKEDPEESRALDIAIGIGFGAGIGKLFSGPAKKSAEKAIQEMEQGAQKLLPPPPRLQRAFKEASTAGPRPVPRAPIPPSRALVPQTTGRALVPTPKPTGVARARADFARLSTQKNAAAWSGVSVPARQRMMTKAITALKQRTESFGKQIAKATTALKKVKQNSAAANKILDKINKLREDRIVTFMMRREIQRNSKALVASAPKLVAGKATTIAKIPVPQQVRDAQRFLDDLSPSINLKTGVPVHASGKAFKTPTTKSAIVNRLDEVYNKIPENVENLTLKQLKRELAQAQAEVRLADRLVNTGQLGGKQRGAIDPRVAHIGGGAVLGGVAGGIVGDGPEGILAGAALGALGGKFVSKPGKIAAKFRAKETVGKATIKLQKAEAEAGKLGKLIGVGPATAVNETMSAIKNGLRDYIGALGTHLRIVAPQLADDLETSVYRSHQLTQDFLGKTESFGKLLSKSTLSDADSVLFKQAMLGNRSAGVKFLRSRNEGALADEFERSVAPMLDDVKVYLEKNGYDTVHMREGFFPRQVIDKTYFDTIPEAKSYLERLARKKKTDLSDFEAEDAMSNLLNGLLVRSESKAFGKAASNLKLRKIGRVTNENVNAYSDLMPSLHHYVEGVVRQVERQKFLSKNGAKDVIGPNGENLDNAVNGLKKMLLGAKREDGTVASVQDVDMAAHLIKSLFGQGEKAPARAAQNFKNLTLTALLGNPLATMTQFGDLALSSYRNAGFANTATAFINELSRKGSLTTGLDKTTLLGIRNATIEFASGVKSRDLLDGALTVFGFKWVDTLGKNVFINAAMKANQKMPKEEFVTKWRRIFDHTEKGSGPAPNTNALYDKVQRFNRIDSSNRDDVGLMMWNELQRAQPISPTAMPKAFHDNPNGRLFYMLQSFSLRVLDMLRRDVLHQVQQKNYNQAARNFTKLAAYFTLMNGSVDAAKDFVRGRPQASVQERVVDNMLRMAGVSKYFTDQASREGIGKAVGATVLPPTTLLDEPLRAFKLGGTLDRFK